MYTCFVLLNSKWSSYFSSILIIISSALFVSTRPHFISNGSDVTVSPSNSNTILILNLLNLVDMLIKVSNILFLARSSDISIKSSLKWVYYIFDNYL